MSFVPFFVSFVSFYLIFVPNSWKKFVPKKILPQPGWNPVDAPEPISKCNLAEECTSHETLAVYKKINSQYVTIRFLHQDKVNVYIFM